MPSRFTVRNFEENAYYHVFNRGVEKRKIFLDHDDYKTFAYYLFIYLRPLDEVLAKYPDLPIRLHNKNLSSEVVLISYCLMPNHFHLLLKQCPRNAISKFIKQLSNAYTEYFNKKYKRSGSLFQGTFKAVRVSTDEQLLHLSRYISLNPLVGGIVDRLEDHPWSSYMEIVYGGDSFVKKGLLQSILGSTSYERFVKDQADYSKKLKDLEGLLIEN